MFKKIGEDVIRRLQVAVANQTAYDLIEQWLQNNSMVHDTVPVEMLADLEELLQEEFHPDFTFPTDFAERYQEVEFYGPSMMD